jgi:hypothetical protein
MGRLDSPRSGIGNEVHHAPAHIPPSDAVPVPGDRVQALTNEYMKLPRTTVDKLGQLINDDSGG